jgi:DNA mismatch repair protein MutS
MMQQYRRIKSEVPRDALLFFRLGDFYEMFFDDAKDAAALLNLTLTKRNGIPMCGVPYHSAEGYITKLIQAGRRVAICEQTTEPAPGKMVERAVTQILSPGCVISLEITQPRENRFLAAAVREKDAFGLAFLDASTGEFRVTECAAEKNLLDELTRLQPKELLEPETAARLDLSFPADQSPARTSHDDWAFEYEQAYVSLREHFKIQSLDGFGCEHLRLGIRAAGGLLHYVSQVLRSPSQHVRKLQAYQDNEFLVLDAITQRNLELVTPAGAAAGDTTLVKAMDQTVTPMGGRELRRWILHPLRQAGAIIRRQQAVKEWLEDIGRLEQFREWLGEVRDLERLIGRLAQGSGNARDLLALGHSLEKLPALRQLAASIEAPLARELSLSIEPEPELQALIARAIHPEPPAALKEAGLIRDGYDAGVDELRAASRDGKSWLADLQAREQQRTGISSLKVRFNQVFGYYIEITKTHLDKIPDNYTRKQTMVGAERFITPELKEMETKILGAEERLQQLEYEVFLKVRDDAVACTARIQQTARAIAQLDVLASFAVLARLRDYRRPEISENGKLEIEEGRHPVLEQITPAGKFVPNDAKLDDGDNRLVILTGPNMAGKSTYIRQVALIALMAHTGSYVPALRATVPLLDRIFTRVGASDDLSRGQSTFMVEMNETANILNNATSQSLVILDEIGRGTSTFDGLSIAWAVAEFLHTELRAKTLFATHYHELTELSLLLSGVKNYNVAVREWHDEIIFLRKIVPGGTDKSYGIQVARLAGLPSAVVKRAREILRNLEEHELDATGRPHLVSHQEAKAKKAKAKQTGKKKPDTPQLDLFKAGTKSE